RLREGSFPVALEITPPKKPLPRVLLRRARLLGEDPVAVNVIQRPERQSSLDASLTLLEAGFDPVWHMVVRGETRDSLAQNLARAAKGGIRNVLCIRGDNPPAEAAELTIKAAVGMACELLPGATVGATLNQYSGS